MQLNTPINNIFPKVSNRDREPVSIATKPKPATIEETMIGAITPSRVFPILSEIMGLFSRRNTYLSFELRNLFLFQPSLKLLRQVQS